MRLVRILSIVILGALAMTGCAAEPETVMPAVTGKRLDVALSEIERAGFGDDVEVDSTGLFGVFDESNWQVCDQSPAAGEILTEPPHLAVDRSCTDDTSATEEESAELAPEPSPTTLANPVGEGRLLTYGETAHFTSTAGSRNTPLAITVSPPTPFTPSAEARVTDARVDWDVRERSLLPSSVYFTVTIENLSPDESYPADFIFSDVRTPVADDQVAAVRDGEIQGIFALQEIPPGGSLTILDGHSVQDAERIEYEFDIDGLAGTSFYFTY